MTRPNIQIPKEFAINGEKADFTQEKIQTGFDKLNPDIFAGDNANKFIDDTYKGLNAVLDLYNGVVLHDMTTTYDDKAVVGKFIENSFKLYHSLVNDNTGHEVTETEYWEEVALGGGSGLEICDIGMSLYVDETKGLRRYLNGQIVDINTNTQAFFTRLQEITTLHPSLLCTEEEWQTAKTMSKLGQCGKFVFNYGSDGITVVSVRLPAVVNINGLVDMSNAGLIKDESLPNIRGTLGGLSIYADQQKADGAFEATNLGTYGSANNGYGQASNKFDASRSSSTYQDNAPVQQEAIQYPYFIQIATGSGTENNIVNEIELNNPYSLFDSKYSDHELNNLSWLKSEGQWNAKSVYPTAYDKLLKVYNGTETVEGLSVKLSTEEYTDYDFVLNTSDETFRLPLKTKLASGKAVVGNGISLGFTDGTNNSGLWWDPNVGGNDNINAYGVSIGQDVSSNPQLNFNNKAIGVTTDPTKSGIETSDSDLYLYFYIGETVQNANLIDAGRIGEQLANKVDTSNTQWATNACIPDYSAGVTQYVDTEYTATIDGFIFVFVYGNMEGHLSVNGIDFHIQMVTQVHIMLVQVVLYQLPKMMFINLRGMVEISTKCFSSQ